MSHWSYRVVHDTFVHENGEKEDTYAIHETYYDGAGVPTSISVMPDPAQAESLDGLQDVLVRMLEALKKPVLEYGDF